MGTQYRRTGEKRRLYSFLDADCIARPCWAPGIYQSRGATLSGSRNTGNEDLCCMRRAYHGCPHPLDAADQALSKARKADGWRRA